MPSHACIITAANEQDCAIKEVIPNVLLALKGSDIAGRVAGRIRPLLLFVYSKVGTSDKDEKELEENARSLIKELQNAEKKIARRKVAGPGEVDIQSNGKQLAERKLLRDFRFSSKDKGERDIKYLGYLTKGGKPPEDTPNFEYGKRICEVREYIEKRLEDCKFSTLTNWISYLDQVKHSIDTSDFELNFTTIMEHQRYCELEKEIYDIQTKFSGDVSVECANLRR